MAAGSVATARTDAKWLTAGLIAGPLFLIIVTIDALTRPAFDLTKHAISMLSLGDRGWLMASTFIVSGLLTLLFAVGMRRLLKGTRAGTWGPLLLGVFGVGLAMAGVFPAPAGLGFPAGTPIDQEPVITTTAMLHNVAFMLSFGSLIASCFVFARRFAADATKTWRTAAIAFGIGIPVTIMLGMSQVVPVGYAFYFATVFAWVWVFALAARSLSTGMAHK